LRARRRTIAALAVPGNAKRTALNSDRRRIDWVHDLSRAGCRHCVHP